MKYLATDVNGTGLAMLEAEDESNARLYAERHIKRFSRLAPYGEGLQDRLQDSFKKLGLSEAEAKFAAESCGPGLPTIQVPNQQPSLLGKGNAGLSSTRAAQRFQEIRSGIRGGRSSGLEHVELRETGNLGSILTGFATSPKQDEAASNSNQERIAKAFQQMGLSEAAAIQAAKDTVMACRQS